MFPQRASLPAVTAAGVVAILFGALGVLFGILVQVSLLLVPTSSSQAGMPAGTRVAASVIWIFLTAIAVAEIFVGVGVFRRRNWARITILIWAGLMAFFTAVSAVVVFFVIGAMPLALPNPAKAASFLLFMKFFLLTFYGIPFGVGVWWLILFTRPRVAAAFKSSNAAFQAPPALDPSGFPRQPASPTPAVLPKPSCPVPLLVIAGILLSSAVSTPIFILLPTTPSVPFFFFGKIFYGSITKIVLVALALFYGIAAIGLIRLKPLALDLILGLQAIFLLNGIASVASPSFLLAMHEVMGQVASSNPALPANFPFFTDSFFRAMLFFGLIFSLGIVAVLVAYRARFIKAAEAAR